MKDLLQKLFSSKKPVSVHEVYQPSSKEIQKYQHWLERNKHQEIRPAVLRAYESSLGTHDEESFVQHYAHQSSNCMVIHVSDAVKQEDLLPLMMWISDSIKEAGYRIVNQDRMIRELTGYVQTKVRMYHKPPMAFELPVDQLYGNVLLELISEDNAEKYLKLTVTSYQDRNYQPAKSFNEMLDLLFRH